MNNKIIILIVIIAAVGAFIVLRNPNKNSANPQPAPSPTPTSDELSQTNCGYTTPIGQGPYYVSNAPYLADGNLNYTGQPGDTLILTGHVYEGIEEPTPIANAEIDLWQTDANGDYHPLGDGDASDYNLNEIELRGVINTDEQGFYQVQTILPDEYSGRPRHMHVKVRADNKPELTTQLYWQQPNDENVVSDSDLNSESRDCQILTAEYDGSVLRSEYDFYLR